jgi:hypothetical protein
VTDDVSILRIGKADALTLFLFCAAGPIIGIAYWGMFTQGLEGLLAPLFVALAVSVLPGAALPMIAVLGLLPALASAIADIAARRRYRFVHALSMTAATGVLVECLALVGTGTGLRPELILSAFAAAVTCSIFAKWVRFRTAVEAATR